MCERENLDNLLGELVQVDAVLAAEGFAKRVERGADPGDQDVFRLCVNVLVLRFD